MNNTACDLNDSDSGCELVKPPLKWAGGKRWLVPQLAALFDNYRDYRLVEPFVGGMAVALGLRPKQALLADANPHLINFYTHLKEGLEISLPMTNEREFYLRQRARFNQMILNGQQRSRQAAEIFYYLNRTGFNGLCRFNSKGFFNVPFGRYTKINYLTDYGRYKNIFSGWSFGCGDFEALEIAARDFIYLDPPYDVEFTRYSKDDFTWQDQVRLVSWLTKFNNPIVASNQATERIVNLYRAAGFEIKLLPAPRRISCTGDRSPAMEMLATRNV